MDERIEKWLHDILIAIENIDRFVGPGPRRFADFVDNDMLRFAVERNIEIIGEAMNRILKVNPDFSLTHARKIVDTRNYVVHAYDSLKPERLWSIIIKDLSPLKAEVKELLAQ
jgi:uncharacterized protein with HEPN domain